MGGFVTVIASNKSVVPDFDATEDVAPVVNSTSGNARLA